ncbi:type II secretion system protein [Lentisphaerota bacterium ZTH]|nr:hypothetical protein JYG24_13255 [Lentisphaerota bacterium]WET05546.1 type II secretion system protein [Lentisphaerota bacterium ZTH]
MFKTKKFARKNFSLIELLIVVAIMGALTALILPQFQSAEEDAKDTACDYNNAGTLRYVSMFKAANGFYPTGFHAGYGDAGATLSADESLDCTRENMGDSQVLTDKQVESLKAAGIKSVAFGHNLAAAIDNTTKVCQIAAGDKWFEDVTTDPATGAVTGKGTTEEMLIRGKSVGSYADAGSIVVPLFAAPTVDWEKYYPDGAVVGKDSKVSVSLVGKCPWPDDGKLRYYICFFKVNNDGSAAKLIGTACPECGSLEAGAF